eukprot:163310-Amphidinium_carterae.1
MSLTCCSSADWSATIAACLACNAITVSCAERSCFWRCACAPSSALGGCPIIDPAGDDARARLPKLRVWALQAASSRPGTASSAVGAC